MPKEQKRARTIAMTEDELDAFLAVERTCRIATVGHDGAPHTSALWFVWDGDALWLYSIVKSQRWTNLMRDASVSVLVDGGVDYFELQGVEMLGSVTVVGEAPRVGEPNAELAEPERLFAQKYRGRDDLALDERHAWLRLVPEKVVSWDFRKLGAASRSVLEPGPSATA